MRQSKKRFALCLDNADYEVSLIPGKVYRIIADERAAQDDLVRIVDESGEDYLYHKSLFVFVDFPKSVDKEIAGPRSGLVSEYGNGWANCDISHCRTDWPRRDMYRSF